MSIYYTPDPDDYEGEPRLPPLLRAQAVEANKLEAGHLHSYALTQAAQVDPGTVFYAEAGGIACFSVVLAPDVPAVQAAQMFHAMMVGVGDAIGALAPPEVEVNYLFPGYVLLNRGRAGTVQVSVDPAAGLQDEPAWMVASVAVRIDADMAAVLADGVHDETSLIEESATAISGTRIIEASCRHFLAWLNRWEEDGFRPVFDAWNHRAITDTAVELETGTIADWVGLDEDGQALLRIDGKVIAMPAHLFVDATGPLRPL